ncbi:four-helix bundle copper-binding protein [Antribacter sp. KLBMP9083]|uniref:Four-helix bundle copper-binding protein n=1 Tax=Antribacter soli TaxID=2910976 RepID=A0AA41QCC3_9MICO|nr:four-helix bundle copper-binding protein [Antribacter soli]MCF4120532.1 four-helix bundle copper-binding protein [Antribacter soli]
MNTNEMLKAYPHEVETDVNLVARVVDALNECAEACTACADACLAEVYIGDLRLCIRTDLDCADSSMALARMLTRRLGFPGAVIMAHLQATIVASSTCAVQCEQHAEMHDHCRLCAEACRTAEAACRELLSAMESAAKVVPA